MDTPITDYIESLMKTGPIPLHTPGHKGNGCFYPKKPIHTALSEVFRFDLADDQGRIREMINRSEESAERLYRTRKSLYLVNGSTAGIMASFLSLFKPGDRVLMGRNVHVSAVSALISTGVKPVFVPCRFQEGFPLNVTAEDLREFLESTVKCRGVFITSPSYQGICADTSEISKICREKLIPLIVDEAWGAHFPFSRDLPDSAIYSGADLVINGLHKTLPSLTGTAILHVCSDRIDVSSVQRALSMVETTSPNILFYMSIECALKKMEEEGNEILSRALSYAESVREILKDLHPAVKVNLLMNFHADPLKVNILVNRQEYETDGFRLCRMMNGNGIYPEMAELDRITLLFTGFESDEHKEKLKKAFSNLKQDMNQIKKKPVNRKEKSIRYPSRMPVMAMTPRKAFMTCKNSIPLNNSAGRICADTVTPYPPGIPILIPGEIITPEVVNYLTSLTNTGGTVRGLNGNPGRPEISVTEQAE